MDRQYTEKDLCRACKQNPRYKGDIRFRYSEGIVKAGNVVLCDSCLDSFYSQMDEDVHRDHDEYMRSKWDVAEYSFG